MPDDKNVGGSNQGPVVPSKSQNLTAKIAYDEVLAEPNALKEEKKVLEKTVKELTDQLKAANDILEGQARAKLYGEILPRSKYTVEDLNPKSLEELQRIKITLDQAKTASFKSIRFGSTDTDESEFTVGDLSKNAPWRKIREGR